MNGISELDQKTKKSDIQGFELVAYGRGPTTYGRGCRLTTYGRGPGKGSNENGHKSNNEENEFVVEHGLKWVSLE